jgi:hypothetical protein
MARTRKTDHDAARNSNKAIAFFRAPEPQATIALVFISYDGAMEGQWITNGPFFIHHLKCECCA